MCGVKKREREQKKAKILNIFEKYIGAFRHREIWERVINSASKLIKPFRN